MIVIIYSCRAHYSAAAIDYIPQWEGHMSNEHDDVIATELTSNVIYQLAVVDNYNSIKLQDIRVAKLPHDGCFLEKFDLLFLWRPWSK